MRDVIKMQKRIFAHMQVQQDVIQDMAINSANLGLKLTIAQQTASRLKSYTYTLEADKNRSSEKIADLQRQVDKLGRIIKLEKSRTRVEDARGCFNEAMLDEQAKIIKELKESNANITHSLESVCQELNDKNKAYAAASDRFEISKKAGRAAAELIGDLKRDVEKWKNAAVVSVCINVVVAIMLFAIVNGG